VVTKNELENELREAMRSGDEVTKRTLRLVLTEVKLAEVENKGELNDEALQAVLQKQVKTRNETIADAEKAGRPEMVSDTKEELEILQRYLPAQLGDAEIEAMAKDTIEETGASDPTEMGAVMKILIPKVQGRADGKRVSQIVRTLLNKD
jgi:uncharacterized protein YqeY